MSVLEEILIGYLLHPTIPISLIILDNALSGKRRKFKRKNKRGFA